MTTIYEIRRDNLRTIINDRGATSVAKACGYNSPSYISQMAGKNPTRPITEDNARKFEIGLGLPKRWLDIERDSFGNQIAEKSPSPVKEAPIPITTVDVDRFTLVASIVRDAANERKLTLTTKQFTEVVSIVYDDFSKDSPSLKVLANRLISLIA